MKRILILLIAIIMLAACSTSEGIPDRDLRYIEKYIIENVSYEISGIRFSEYKEEVDISIKSSSVAYEDFGDFANQAFNAARAATAEKSVQLDDVEVAITDKASTNVLTWNTEHSYGDTTGTIFDYRIPGYTGIISDVMIDNLQQEVDKSAAESPLFAKVHNYVVYRSPYEIDHFNIYELDDKPGHYRGHATSYNVDSELIDDFQTHVSNIAFLICEIQEDIDVIIDRVYISARDLDGNETDTTIYAPFDEDEFQSASASDTTSATTTARTVYWVSGGSVYHTRKSCPALSDSSGISSGTIAQSGKSRVCQRCG